MKVEEMSSELLLANLLMTCAKTINYPNNKKYPKELRKLELEVLSRMGGNAEEYDKIDQ